MYTLAPSVHPSITAHCQTPFVKSARFDKKTRSYWFVEGAGQQEHSGPGLIRTLKKEYFPNFDLAKEAKKKRNGKEVNVRGSTSRLGTRVDQELMRYCVDGKIPRGRSKFSTLTMAIIEYWKSLGHTPQAAQLPVQNVQGWKGMTQADFITRDPFGNLCLWEVKTGYPVGGFTKHGCFKGHKNVDCTKINIWQLQLHFTRKALVERAKIPIAHACIIQVYTKRDQKEPIVKIHKTATWTREFHGPV